MPGIPKLLSAARMAGLQLAVGSSSIRRFVTTSLERLFASIEWDFAPRHVFRAIVCGDDPGVAARKPAPDIYLRCARDLGVAPSDCLVVEDSASGIESARRAGIVRAVAIPNRYTHAHDFSRAYRVLGSADEVLECISISGPGGFLPHPVPSG
jgi:beta-phosphoglucomutase-like phosphatase (HAD superfamily)